MTLLGQHQVAVRAVARGDYRSLDPTPAIVDLTVTAPTPEVAPDPTPSQGAGGCQQGANGSPLNGLWLCALLVGATLGTRWRWAALALLGMGCDDPKPAPEIACAVSADCPGGLLCLSGRCVQPTPCQTNAECCPDAECRAGGCVPLAADCAADAECAGLVCVDGRCQQPPCGDCAAGQCIAGHCQIEPPCRGQCGPDEACFGHLNLCRAVACAVECGPGEVRMAVTPERFTGPQCQVTDAACECALAPPILPADVGRHASMAVVADRAEFVAWDADFGDLVYVEGIEDGAPRLTYLDGVPDQAAQADPSGPRGGVTDPGPDRGRYAHLAFDLKGRPNVVYYDADAGALRYIRRDESGWIAPIIVDAEGDAGRYPRIAIDGLGVAHIVYSVVATVDGQAGLRYAVARSSEPIAPADFNVQTIASQPVPDPAVVAPPGITPAVFGVRPCMDIGPDGRVYAAFYDGQIQRPMLAVGDVDGFAVQPIDGPRHADWLSDPGGRYDRFESHDLGGFCALVVGADALHVALLDATTDALIVWSAGLDGNGVFDLVDPGGRGVRRLVGADPSMALSASGAPVIVYQDATDNDVLMAARAPFGWEITSVATAGALGFYNTLILQGDAAIVGTLELRTVANGRGAHRLHVFRVDAPAF